MPETENALVQHLQETVDRAAEASSSLIVVHCYAASAEIVCRTIELLAGHFAGSTDRTVSRAAFVDFARSYLPDLGGTAPSAALSEAPDEPLPTCADLVHVAWQGGLLHDGRRRGGVRVLDDKRKWTLTLQHDGSAALNAIPFQSLLERGAKAYLADLATDPALLRKAAVRAAYLAHPPFRPLNGDL